MGGARRVGAVRPHARGNAAAAVAGGSPPGSDRTRGIPLVHTRAVGASPDTRDGCALVAVMPRGSWSGSKGDSIVIRASRASRPEHQTRQEFSRSSVEFRLDWGGSEGLLALPELAGAWTQDPWGRRDCIRRRRSVSSIDPVPREAESRRPGLLVDSVRRYVGMHGETTDARMTRRAIAARRLQSSPWCSPHLAGEFNDIIVVCGLPRVPTSVTKVRWAEKTKVERDTWRWASLGSRRLGASPSYLREPQRLRALSTARASNHDVLTGHACLRRRVCVHSLHSRGGGAVPLLRNELPSKSRVSGIGKNSSIHIASYTVLDIWRVSRGVSLSRCPKVHIKIIQRLENDPSGPRVGGRLVWLVPTDAT